MSRESDQTLVERLGDFVGSVRYEDLSSWTDVGAKTRLLDAVSCVFAGRRGPSTALALAMADQWSSSGPSSFWLSHRKGRAEDCAFVNSVLIHGTLLDDGPLHIGCVVVPTALAVAEAEGRSGQDVLAAIAAGYETTLRIDAGGLSDTSCEQGFRHSWPAAFGATAAAAHLMKLGPAAIKDALALTAAVCNPGTMEPMGAQGSSERFVQMGAVAKNGVFAATLARAGFTGIDTALEGDAGIYFAYTGGAEAPGGAFDDAVRGWHWDEMTFKSCPGSGVGVVPIHCAERLVRDREIQEADIATIELRVVPQQVQPPMKGPSFAGPFTNFEQALMSIPFSVAAILLFGAYDFDVVLEALRDPRVDALARKVQIFEIPGIRQDDHSITVVYGDGRRFTATSSDLPDRSFRATTWEKMVARFHELASSLPRPDRERIVSEIDSLDRRSSCDGIVELLRTT